MLAQSVECIDLALLNKGDKVRFRTVSGSEYTVTVRCPSEEAMFVIADFETTSRAWRDAPKSSVYCSRFIAIGTCAALHKCPTTIVSSVELVKV